MDPRSLSAVVLAAGEGTRMRSTRPKPLHPLCGRAMVLHVLDAVAGVGIERIVTVVGHGAAEVEDAVRGGAPAGVKAEFAVQADQRGTGDAALVGLSSGGVDDLDVDDDVLVLPGDTPLLTAPTLAAMVREHRLSDAAATVLTARVADPTGYGRIVRGPEGGVERSVEHRDAGAAELGIDEVNTSIYCFRRSLLAPALRRLSPDNAQGEYYLTDVLEVLAAAGHTVIGVEIDDTMEAAGVNDRAQLAAAEAELRARINERHMRDGVSMLDPESTYVDATVELARDVVLLPGTHLAGRTQVGEGARIGPDAHLVDTRVGAGAVVRSTHADHAEIGAGAAVGPFAVLQAGAVVADGGTAGPFAVVAGP